MAGVLYPQQEETEGILNRPATVNPLIARQVAAQRAAYPRNILNTPQQALDFGAGIFGMVPGVGDAMGLASDLNRYREDPGSRTMGNFGLTGLGLLPLIPNMTNMVKKGYRIAHRPMKDAGGAARLHDLTKSFPEDVYGPQALQFYGSGDPREKSVIRTLRALRGKPDAEITIYRGVPKDAPGIINKGDWVTLSPEVAKDYGEQVISMKVKAKDVTSWADSLLEFGYFPD